MTSPGGAERPPGARSTDLGTRLAGLLRGAREGVFGLRSSERRFEVLTIVALLGGGLLILAEFLTLFEIEARDLVVKQQAGGSHHAYAMLVVGTAMIGATLLTRSTGQWPPALGIVMLGVFALAFALIGDLPDATRSDLVRGARIADAHPAVGFWMEVAGAVVAIVNGLALLRVLRRESNRRRA
jgi:hypothetical protein